MSDSKIDQCLAATTRGLNEKINEATQGIAKQEDIVPAARSVLAMAKAQFAASQVCEEMKLKAQCRYDNGLDCSVVIDRKIPIVRRIETAGR